MVYDLVGITQFLVNWESAQTEVKDCAQCSLPRTYILSGKQYQYGSQLHVYHFPNGIRDVILSFIGILPSHNLGTNTKLTKTNLTSTIIDYCPQIFSFKIVNADKMFETKKYFYYRYVSLLIAQMWNHLPFPTQISHTPSQRHLYFGKTLTRYCDHRVCFNGICCPPLIMWGQYAKVEII